MVSYSVPESGLNMQKPYHSMLSENKLPLQVCFEPRVRLGLHFGFHQSFLKCIQSVREQCPKQEAKPWSQLGKKAFDVGLLLCVMTDSLQCHMRVRFDIDALLYPTSRQTNHKNSNSDLKNLNPYPRHSP